MLIFKNNDEPLRILYLEDSPRDVELVRETLEHAGFSMMLDFVDKEVDYVNSLKAKKYDIILADYNLPGFKAPAALSYALKICPETPFICISGAIGEDAAVELLKNGATNYVSKERLKSLPLAVERALHDVTLNIERKTASERTIANEARLAEAQAIAHLGSWEWDFTTDKISWSDELCRLFGISTDTVNEGIDNLRAAIESRVVPDDRPKYKEAVSGSLNHKTPYSIDYRIQLPDGLVRHINARGDFKNDNSGKVIKMVGTAIDITERKQAEKALKESEEKYRLLADHMKDIVWLMDMNFKVIYQSPSSEKLRGFTSEEIAELPMEQNFTPESLKSALEVFQTEIPRIIADLHYNPLNTLELEYYKKDGTTFWLENKFSIVRNGGGKPISILGEGRDITDRRQAQEALNRSLSLLEATFESIHNGILVVSSDGSVIKTNSTFAQMWRIPDEVIASGDDNVLLKHVLDQLSDPDEFIAKVNELYAKPEAETFDFIYFRDGRIFERISKPMFLEGKPKGRVWSFLDITSRNKAEEALREERWRLENIVEATRAGTWEWNVQTGEAMFNERWAQMAGYTLAELAPTSIKTWQSLVHPDDLEKSNILLDQHYIGILPYYDCECRMKHKDGHWVWIHDRGRVITRTPEGKPLMMFGTHTDITNRKNAEESLRISQQRFSQLVNQLNDIIWQANGNGTGLTDVNNSFEKYYGISSAEFIKNPALWIDVVHPDDRKIAEDGARKLFETGNSANEYRILRPDGKIVWLHDRKSIIYDQNGKPIQMGGIATDITERKLLEEQLLIKDFAIEASPTAVGLSDLNGIVFYANKAFVKLWGYNDKNEILGKPIADFSLAKEHSQMVLAIISQGENFYGETNCIRKDGRVFISMISASMVKSVEGRPICSMALFTDITERKKAEEEIKQMNLQLKEINDQKDKFFSIIAHDLKSPFNSIIGFSDILVENVREKNYEDIGKYAEIILKSSERAVDLLMNLMEWARSQTGRMEFNPKPLEIVDIINEVTLLMSDIAGQKSIIIKKDMPQIAFVYADVAMINTILRNLITNAVKFTMPGGEIILSVRETQNEFTISVRDNGVGIPGTRIDKLFRIDENYTTRGTQKEQGTGLGLILCKEFVEKNGGRIWVESEEAKGSTFYFTLPGSNKNQ